MNIIGIRYIGKKPVQEDTVTKSGAVWEPGQVHNFSADDGAKLLQHTDSFEMADVNPEGDFYAGRKRSPAPHEPPPFVNLSAMNAAALALFARRELNRVVNIEGKQDDQVRAEVLSLMRVTALDEAATVPSHDLMVYPLAVTPEELAGLQAGALKAKIVPALKLVQPSGTSDVQDGETLDSLLARLDKEGLIELAEQEGVALDKRWNEEKLREHLRGKLQAA